RRRPATDGAEERALARGQRLALERHARDLDLVAAALREADGALHELAEPVDLFGRPRRERALAALPFGVRAVDQDCDRELLHGADRRDRARRHLRDLVGLALVAALGLGAVRAVHRGGVVRQVRLHAGRAAGRLLPDRLLLRRPLRADGGL